MKTNSLLITQGKTPNQITRREFVFRRLKPITRAIALAECLAVILAATAATAQTKPVATVANATASTAEVAAFVQSLQQDPNAVFKISVNPKRVDHPNIACVFDGGATDTGRPNFVMELVKSFPLGLPAGSETFFTSFRRRIRLTMPA